MQGLKIAILYYMSGIEWVNLGPKFMVGKNE